MTPSTIAPLLTIPPLESGDRLTRCEFERRYEAMPHHQKAELIEGVVYMASPLRVKAHGEPHIPRPQTGRCAFKTEGVG